VYLNILQRNLAIEHLSHTIVRYECFLHFVEMMAMLASCRVKAEDNEFLKHLEEVKKQLQLKLVPQPAISYVEDVLVAQHQRYHEKSAGQAAKMKTLEEYLREIEVNL
jgi:hypothetical protein